MTVNSENRTEIPQENLEKSENNQENSELNIENPVEDTQTEPSSEENPSESTEEGEELEIPEPDVSDEEVKKKKDLPEWMKKKLEREKASAERKEAEALALKQENDRLKALTEQQNPQARPSPGVDANLPKRDQFNSDEEYFLAVADYRDEMRQNAAVEFHRQQAFQKAEKEYQDGIKNTVEEGKIKYKDFEDRTDFILYGDTFPHNRAMGEAIVASEYKSDILYFLGTYLKEAERIASLNPVAAVKEITKLEARLAAKKRSNITKSPKLIGNLSGSKGAATHIDPGKMDQQEFNNWYKETYG